MIDYDNHNLSLQRISSNRSIKSIISESSRINEDNLRINEISYSYQDGSSYTINVSLGPVYVGTGSWNTSIWQRRTETVSSN
jgi:hypothetical protein